ncbi:MAG: GNAT family N-acetyltransferase [Kiritimatiellae bacterium]|nr:GNAT family N-acetyltransferase [Kiritimatiellia bacterium]
MQRRQTMKRVVRGAKPNELDNVLEFLNAQMGPASYFEARMRTHPTARPADSRIVLVGRQVAAHIRVFRKPMRLRGGVITAGHLAEVITHPDHRRHGYGGAVLRDCAAYIRAQGWPLSCVWSGVTNFYCSEDWVRFPLVSTTLQTAFWRPEPSPGIRVRRYERGRDDAAAAEIYAAYNRDRDLSVVRDAEYWRLHHSWIRGEDESAFLIAEKNGEPVGYCRGAMGGGLRDSTPALLEYGVRDGHGDAGVALVTALIRWTKERSDTLNMRLPVDEPLITQYPRLRYSRSLTETMLMRVIDLKGILDVALTNADQRLKTIGFKGARTIAMEVLGQKCAIEIAHGSATARRLPKTAAAAPFPQTEFFKLLFGATMEKDLSGFSREDQHLLRDLFPPAGPVYWRADVL